MTDVRVDGGAAPRLQSVSFVPDALTGEQASGGLLTLVAVGDAPVCDGDSCFVPGAEGVWAEVPD